MSNLALLRSSYSLNDVMYSYYASGCLPRRLTFKPLIHSLPQRYALLHQHSAIKTNLPLNQRASDLFKISSSITTRLLIMNADMRHTFSNLGNVSTRDDELLSLAAFYTEHVSCIIVITDENVPDRLIPTCSAVVAGRSGIKESITTTTPLSRSHTLHKKERSSDLRADFLRDEPLVVRLVPLRQIPTIETLVPPRGSPHDSPSVIQATVVSGLTNLPKPPLSYFKATIESDFTSKLIVHSLLKLFMLAC